MYYLLEWKELYFQQFQDKDKLLSDFPVSAKEVGTYKLQLYLVREFIFYLSLVSVVYTTDIRIKLHYLFFSPTLLDCSPTPPYPSVYL